MVGLPVIGTLTITSGNEIKVDSVVASYEIRDTDCVIAVPYNDQTKGQSGTWDLTIYPLK